MSVDTLVSQWVMVLLGKEKIYHDPSALAENEDLAW